MNNKNFKALVNLFSNKPEEIYNMCSNIFTMREIGNKTHGDMAEVAVTAFINKFLSNYYSAFHVGKALFRQKKKEEDVLVVNKTTDENIPISIKAYGDGNLQLSTDKEYTIFPLLESYNKNIITNQEEINEIINNIDQQLDLNVLLFIYDEKKLTCKIMLYDFDKVKDEIKKIEKVLPGGARKYPIYKFLNENNDYLFEVRYGGKNANALQRGIWTHTVHAKSYFINISNGEIKYEIRQNLIDVISILMISSNSTINKLREEII